MISSIFTFYITIIMIFILAIHIYWLKGGLWPGENEQDLINKVIGKGQMPNTLAYVIVIFGFLLMALIPVLLYFKLHFGFLIYLKYILAFFSFIFFVRAASMFIANIEKGVAKEFIKLNKKIYAPLCFSLGLSYLFLYFNY